MTYLSNSSAQDSRVDTIAIPAIGTRNPATLVIASRAPMRLVVRNGGPVLIFLAHTSSEISNIGVTAGVYQLPPGMVDIFVLQPKQGMWAVGQGAGGIVSIAVSEALLQYWQES